MDLQEGYTLQLGAPRGGSYPRGAPSLLGRTYMAAHGATRLVVGASKGPGDRLDEAPKVAP